MKRSTGFIIAIVTAILSLISYYYIAQWLHVVDPWFTAWVLLIAIMVHEMGHLIAFEAFGIKTHIFFLVILGGALPDPKYQHIFEKFSSTKKATIYFAGIAGNLAIVLVSWLLFGLDAIDRETFGRIANLNGNLVLFNLLPLWTLDGGRFAGLLFDSIPESQDTSYAKLIGIVTIGGLIAVMIASNKMLLLPAVLMIHGLKKKSETDDPHGSSRRGAFRSGERFVWIGMWIAFVLIGAALYASNPDFIKVGKQQPKVAVFYLYTKA
jgi:Zn-dependent protease